jgi:heavy metal sensor kinase
MRNPLRSIRVRLTLWYVLALALLLVLFSGGVYLALRDALSDNLDAAIEGRVDVWLHVVQVVDGEPRLPLESASPPTEDASDDDDDPEDELDDEEFVRLYDRQGGLLADTSDSGEVGALDPSVVRRAVDGDAQWLRLRGEDETYRVRIVPVEQAGVTVGALAVGQSEEDLTDTLSALLTVTALALPLALLAAGLVGFLLARRALAPIDRITRTARELSAADLSRRLDLDLPDDELGRLARTFDAMLERIDVAFQRQRQFTADASHELRTPLTIMRGQLEVALSRARPADDYRATLEAQAEQVERLSGLVSSLLTLARADAGQIPLERELLEVAALVESSVEQVAPLADERGVALTTSGPPATVQADATLLVQLLLNLLDNALRHTPPGGTIEVSWAVVGGVLQLLVHDTGSGIAAEHLPRVFERFYRVEQARERVAGGVGIGLAICRWIAEAHGGTITLESAVGVGTTVLVTLPNAR